MDSNGTTRKTASIRTASWWVYLGGTIIGVEPSGPSRFDLVISGVPENTTNSPKPGTQVDLDRFFKIGNTIRSLVTVASQAARTGVST